MAKGDVTTIVEAAREATRLGHPTRALRALARLASGNVSGQPALEWEVLALKAVNLARTGHWDRAVPLYRQAADLARAAGDGPREAWVYQSMAAHAVRTDRLREAIEWGKRALAAYRELGMVPEEVGALQNLAVAMRRLGRLEEARRLLEHAYAGASGAYRHRILTELGEVARLEGDTSRAVRLGCEAWDLALDRSDMAEVGSVHLLLAKVAQGEGWRRLARHLAARAEGIFRELSMEPELREAECIRKGGAP